MRETNPCINLMENQMLVGTPHRIFSGFYKDGINPVRLNTCDWCGNKLFLPDNRLLQFHDLIVRVNGGETLVGNR